MVSLPRCGHARKLGSGAAPRICIYEPARPVRDGRALTIDPDASALYAALLRGAGDDVSGETQRELALGFFNERLRAFG
jgi:hypothetical protein